jgi:hypothetical protein
LFENGGAVVEDDLWRAFLTQHLDAQRRGEAEVWRKGAFVAAEVLPVEVPLTLEAAWTAVLSAVEARQADVPQVEVPAGASSNQCSSCAVSEVP